MPIDSVSTSPKPFIFVLMPFDEAFSDIYRYGIKVSAEEVGAYAERVDEQLFTEGILDRIFNQINKADVIVADMTGRNENVFYEVGYAHALNKIVVLLTQSADDIPFDLKHRPHIVYRGRIEILRERLPPSLEWAIGESLNRLPAGLASRYEINISGVNVPQNERIDGAPIIHLTAQDRNFLVKILVRNTSKEVTPDISYISLLASPTCRLAPWVFDRLEGEGLYTEAFEGEAIDPVDGLNRQYRLKVTLPPLPPGAVEILEFNMGSPDGIAEAEEDLKLRFHSQTTAHDFPFRLNVHTRAQGDAS